jgi:hypothetical protein
MVELHSHSSSPDTAARASAHRRARTLRAAAKVRCRDRRGRSAAGPRPPSTREGSRPDGQGLPCDGQAGDGVHGDSAPGAAAGLADPAGAADGLGGVGTSRPATLLTWGRRSSTRPWPRSRLLTPSTLVRVCHRPRRSRGRRSRQPFQHARTFAQGKQAGMAEGVAAAGMGMIRRQAR